MKLHTRCPFSPVARAAALLAGALVAAAPAGAGDWPQLLGPGRDGGLTGAGLPGGPLRLETVWRRPLGSGYSGIAVSGSTVVTMYSDGESDFLVALDSRTGKTLWQLALGEGYQGHDGSDDGPSSTPLIDGERVFALTPRGRLIAVDRADGKSLWQVSLPEAYGAPEPDYGFATSPLVFDGRVIVQAGGGDGHGLIALDAATGELRWSVGDEPAEYRSPVPVRARGRTHLVVVTRQALRGVDPRSGERLWEHATDDEHPFGDIANVAPAGDGRFVVTGWSRARLFEIVPGDAGFELAERWSTEELKGNYVSPVHHGSRLYGYSGTYLTAIDARTGERLWKSRPPGAGVPIRLDERLVVWAAGGTLSVAPVAEGGFEPVARATVLDTGSLTAPSFADGVVYVRNLDDIAAVAVRPAETAARPAQGLDALTAGTAFGRFVEALPETAGRAAAIDRFLGEQRSFPLVEDGGTVHFVYRGPAADVGIVGSMTPRGSESLRHVPDSDLFYRTYRLEPGSRVEYAFLVDFGDEQRDALNPASAPGSDTRSELALPGWNRPDWAAEPFGDPRGAFETFTIEESAFGDSRTVTVYLPPGHAGGERRYPLVVVPDIDGARERGCVPQILDRLAASDPSREAVVAFVPFGEGFAFWTEAYADKRDDMVRFVADELVPEVARRYRVRDGREHRVLLGTGWGAFPALYVAIQRPDAFGGVATLSLLTYEPLNELLAAALAGREGGPRLAAFLGWGRYDYDPQYAEHIDLPALNRAVADMLGEHGHRVTTHDVPAGLGWGSWWPQLDRALTSVSARGGAARR